MPKDPNLEDAPVSTRGMGTIEFKVFRCHEKAQKESQKERYEDEDLHWGRVSKLSEKAKWHQVAYVPSFKLYFSWSPLICCLSILLALEMRWLSKSASLPFT